MFRKFHTIVIIIGLGLTLVQCANRGNPRGGAKDIDPPVIVRTVPKNLNTNFDGDEITIFFDEYIKLKDVQKQVVISPPMNIEPEITPLGTASKYINIRIYDTLNSNTTYAFNFGESISDNNEGNLFPFYKYVFSTGAVVDSLSISGIVVDALNKETAPRVSVLLYEMDSTYTDSVIYNQKPRYIAVTDSFSAFKLENLKQGKYLLLALEEENKNYIYKQKNDKIAFKTTPISVPSDTIYELKLFKEQLDFKFVRARQEGYNKIAFGYEGNAQAMRIKLLGQTPSDFISVITKDPQADTLNYWFSSAVKMDTLLFEVSHKTVLDTVMVKIKDLEKDSLKLKSETNSLKLADTFVFSSNNPLVDYDSSQIKIIDQDSLVIAFDMTIDTLNTIAKLKFKKSPSSSYTVELLPGAVTDLYGFKNDSIVYKAKTKSLDDYGDFRLNVKNAVYPIIIQLTDKEGEVVEERKSNEPELVDFINVTPGTYNLRVVFDTNNNGQYDPGNFLKRIQPERISYAKEMLLVRAGWDTIEEFVLED